MRPTPPRPALPLRTLLTALALAGGAHAQVSYNPGATSYPWSDSAGNTFNNSLSAVMSQQSIYQNQLTTQIIQNNMQSSMTMNLMMQQAMLSDLQLQAAREERGRAVIAAGRATLLFTPQPYEPPLAQWAQQAKTSVERKRWEYAEQVRVWNDAVKRYGAQQGDMSHVLATASVLAYEGYTGMRASAAAWQARRAEIARTFLADAAYQGYSAQDKAQLANDLRLAGYYVFERQESQRTGDRTWLERAKQEGAAFLDRWWTSDTRGRTDADDSAADLARHGSTPAPVLARVPGGTPYLSSGATKAAVPALAPPPQAARSLSLGEAAARTSFRRSGVMLADLLLRNAPQEGQTQARESAELARNLIGLARDSMGRNTGVDLPVDNVARSLGYAFASLYQVALAQPGRPLEAKPGRLGGQVDYVSNFRRKMALALASSPGFTDLGDADKQMYSEMLLYLSTFPAVLYLDAQEGGRVEEQQLAVELAQALFQTLFGTRAGEFDFGPLERG